MSHLKSSEILNCVDGIYSCIFGSDNYTRWKKLKNNLNMTSGSEADFVHWILDYIDSHLETEDVSVKSTEPRKNCPIEPENDVNDVILLDADSENGEDNHWCKVNTSTTAPATNTDMLANYTSPRSTVSNNKLMRKPFYKKLVQNNTLNESHGSFNIDNETPHVGLTEVEGQGGDVSFCDDFLNTDIIVDDADCTERMPQLESSCRDDSGSSRHYLCEICYTSYPAYKDLLVHQSMVHDKDNTEKCRFCSKSFAHRAIRLRHEKTSHSLRTYTCDMCPKMFFEKASVTRHKKAKHRNIRFQCKKCGHAFTQIGNLRRHEKRMHDV